MSPALDRLHQTTHVSLRVGLYLGADMNVPESWAIEAAKTAMPFDIAQKVAESCAFSAVRDLDKFNCEYTNETPWFDDGSYFKSVPMDNPQIAQASAMLSCYFLTLMYRRGLVSRL